MGELTWLRDVLTREPRIPPSPKYCERTYKTSLSQAGLPEEGSPMVKLTN